VSYLKYEIFDSLSIIKILTDYLSFTKSINL